ncbi:MAG: hypothetical protein JW909_06885 [Planctomycetes bacterium]|nr:hypothetical protein [Planctomycetota bacterium]
MHKGGLLAAATVSLAALLPADEAPPSPFAAGGARKPAGRWGSVLLLGGPEERQTLTGHLSFTNGKLLRLHDIDRKNVTTIRPSLITAIDVAVEKESIEDEWTWKEMGNDEKIRTGRTYPDRTYLFTFTLADGKKHRGHLLGTPVYIEDESGAASRVILRTHQRGDFGKTLKDLVFVARVAFHDPDSPPPWPLKKKAEEEKAPAQASADTGSSGAAGSAGTGDSSVPPAAPAESAGEKPDGKSD